MLSLRVVSNKLCLFAPYSHCHKIGDRWSFFSGGPRKETDKESKTMKAICMLEWFLYITRFGFRSLRTDSSVRNAHGAKVAVAITTILELNKCASSTVCPQSLSQAQQEGGIFWVGRPHLLRRDTTTSPSFTSHAPKFHICVDMRICVSLK